RLVAAAAPIFTSDVVPLPGPVDTADALVGGTPVASPRVHTQTRVVSRDLLWQAAQPEAMIMHRSTRHHRRVSHSHPPRPSLVGSAHTVAFRLRDAPGWSRHQIGCTVITSYSRHPVSQAAIVPSSPSAPRRARGQLWAGAGHS